MILDYINGMALRRVKMFQNPASTLPESDEDIFAQLREGKITPEQAKAMRPNDMEFAAKIDTIKPLSAPVTEDNTAAIQEIQNRNNNVMNVPQQSKEDKLMGSLSSLVGSAPGIAEGINKLPTKQVQPLQTQNLNSVANQNLQQIPGQNVPVQNPTGGNITGALGKVAPFASMAGNGLSTANAISQGDPGAAIESGAKLAGGAAGMAIAGPMGAQVGQLAGGVIGGVAKSFAPDSKAVKHQKFLAEVSKQNKGFAEDLEGQMNYGNRIAMKGSKIYRKKPAKKLKFTPKKRMGGKVPRPPLSSTDYYARRRQVPIGRQGFKIAGLYEATGGRNLIPRGVLHEEWNYLGDKGIPILAKGNKVAEIERDEIIFHLNASEMIERLSKEYEKTGNPSIARKLGEIVRDEILHNTDDKTGKFI